MNPAGILRCAGRPLRRRLLGTALGLLIPLEAAPDIAFLSMERGVVRSALGGGGIAVPGSLEGLHQNPASIAGLKGLQFQASAAPSGTMSLWDLTVAKEMSRGLTVAAAAGGLAHEALIGDIRYSGDPGRALSAGSFSATAGIGLSLGSGPWTVDLGASAQVVAETLDDLNRSAWTGQLGVLVTFPSPLLVALKDRLSVGLQVRDLGLLVGVDRSTTMAVARWGAGLVYSVEPVAGWTLAARGDLLGVLSGSGDEPPGASLGLEIGLWQRVFLRVGSRLGEGLRSIGFGAGVKGPAGSWIPTVDYTLIPLGSLGMEHRIGVSWMVAGPVKGP